MKKYYHIFLSTLLALSGISCSSTSEKDGHNHESTHEHESSSHNEAHEHEHEHGPEIDLHDEIAERFDLQIDTLKTNSFYNSIRVSGEVLPAPADMGVASAPCAGIVRLVTGISEGSKVSKGTVIATVNPAAVAGGDINAAAKANIEAAERELKRIKALYDEKLATASEYNAAVAALDVAKTAYSPSAASKVAVAPVDGIITSLDAMQGQFVDAGTPIATVVASSSLTIRFDLPKSGYALLPHLNDANIYSPQCDSYISLSSIGGKRVGGSAAASTSSAFIPVYFNVRNNGSLIPGSVISGYLLNNQPQSALTLPLTAISEQQGQYFVYVPVHPEKYVKIPVKIGANNGKDVIILSGIEPGTPVVVKGTTAVRLAESGSNIPEGHSHNH